MYDEDLGGFCRSSVGSKSNIYRQISQKCVSLFGYDPLPPAFVTMIATSLSRLNEVVTTKNVTNATSVEAFAEIYTKQIEGICHCQPIKINDCL
jgi:hypothetical protein